MPGVAEVSGRSVGAEHASVRMSVAGGDDVIAHWPEPGVSTSSEHSVPVLEGLRTLGEIAVSMPAGKQLSKTDRTLLADIATQTALGLRNAQLAAQLGAQVDQASRQADELDASRQRLLAAQQSQRQLLTRAVSAEVLPHLARVRTALTQGTAGTAGTAAILRSLDAATASNGAALAALRDVARGVFPPMLARKGLAAALRVYAGRSGGRVKLTISPSAQTARYAPHIEAVTYFCAVETVRDLGGSALVELDMEDSHLNLNVAARQAGDLLAETRHSVVDRVVACGGTVAISVLEQPAQLRVTFPHAPVNAQTAASRSGPNADFAT
jgi:hypothetical protein